jgi:predicted RNA-binding protein with TRAM domain
MPDAYDVISSLYESTDLIKENLIYPGIKVGDEVIVSIGDAGSYGPIINNFATVVSVTEGGTFLVKLKNFNKGHDGNNNIHCGEYDCLFLNGSWFKKLIIRPVESLDMPDAYDVISSLYESKEDDLDWAMDMAKDIANKSVKLSLIPKNKDKNFYLIYFDKPGITYETIQNILMYVKEETIWGNMMTRRDIKTVVPYLYDNYLEKGFVYFSLKPNGQIGYGSTEEAFSRVNNIKITAPNVKIIRPYPYGENINESDDLDWASDMVNDVNSGSLMTVIQKIPTTVDKDKFNVIVFRGPGITKKDITDVIMFTENNTNYTPFFNVETIIVNAINMYNKERFLYINLRPNGVKSVGSSPFTFKAINKVSLSDDRVNVIRFNADKKINESDDFDWVSDMASDISKSIITPGQYYRINGKLAHHPFDDTIDLYIKEVFPEHNYVIFDIISSDPSLVKNNERISLRTVITLIDTKYWYPISKEESLFDKKMNESDDLDWAMDMVNDVNLAITSIPTEDNGKKYVILFDKPGITYETIETIVNYIEKKTVWYFTAVDSVTSSIYGDIKRGWSPYIRLFPGPELSFGDDESTFNNSTGLYFNSPQVNIIRPY